MAKDTLLLFKGKVNPDWTDHGPDSHESELEHFHNILPVPMSNDKLGFKIRPTYVTTTRSISDTVPTSSSDRGRGLVLMQDDLWLIKQDSAHSINGSHSITGGEDFEDDILCDYTESFISQPASGSLTPVLVDFDFTGNADGELQVEGQLPGAFTDYTFAAGDKILLQNTITTEDTSNLVSGFYEVASKVDNDAVLLVADSRLTADQSGLLLSATGLTKFTVLQNPGSYRSAGAAPVKTGSLYVNASNAYGWARLVDPDIPGNDKSGANQPTMVRGVQQLNGRVYVMDFNGAIYNSVIDDVTTWSALNFITSERKNDLPIYLGLHKDHLVAFNNTTIEFFYDAGLNPATGSPLVRRQDIFHNIGAVSPNAIYEVGDIIYFLGWDSSSSVSVYKLENFQLSKISDEHIDVHLQALDVEDTLWEEPPYNVYITTINAFQTGPVLLLTVEDRTFGYIMKTGLWVNWSVGGEPTYRGNIPTWTGCYPVVASTRNSGYTANDSLQTILFTNGQMAVEDTTPTSDLADVGLAADEAYWWSDIWDKGTNERKRVKSVRILHFADKQAANTSEIHLQWSDGQAAEIGEWDSWNTARTVDLNSSKASVYRCGITRQRMYRLTFDQSSRNRIYGIEIDYDLLRG